MIILDGPWIEDMKIQIFLQIWITLNVFVFWTKRFHSGLVCNACLLSKVIQKRLKISFVLQISEEEISVNAGQNLRIPCIFKVDPLNRITEINWTMNDKDLSNERIDRGADGSITIANVQKKHSGIYK